MVARLIFATDEAGTVRLVKRTFTEMTVRVAPIPDRTGTYIDLRTADDQTLVRVAARGAVPTTQEVFPEPPDRQIVRRAGTRPGAFLVTLPVVDGIDHIAVVQLRPDRRTTTLAAFPWEAP